MRRRGITPFPEVVLSQILYNALVVPNPSEGLAFEFVSILPARKVGFNCELKTLETVSAGPSSHNESNIPSRNWGLCAWKTLMLSSILLTPQDLPGFCNDAHLQFRLSC